MQIKMPPKVKNIIDKIYDNGYEAFIVGGCVRDSILGIEPNDYDITTSAKPNEIIEIFKNYKIIDNGIKHGTVGILMYGDVYEITTYRIEGEYENNRRPKYVEFTSDLIKDLKRRDFTINAMAYNDKLGLIDEFNGIDNIKNKIIKTVGNPDERFKEDGLRIIRAIRFSSKLQFSIEENTLKSIYKNASIIKNISKERITEEFTKIILSDNPQKIELLYKAKIFEWIGIYSNIKYYNHLEILNYCDKNLEDRLIMLEYIASCEELKLAEIGKNKYYKEKIKPHSVVNTLKYPKKTVNICNELIEYMIMEVEEVNKEKIKWILNKIGISELKRVLKLKKIYYDCQEKFNLENKNSNTKVELLDKWNKEIQQIEENKECYKIKDLNINGKDIQALGYKGIDVGKKLELLLNEVIKNPELNDKEKLKNLIEI